MDCKEMAAVAVAGKKVGRSELVGNSLRPGVYSGEVNMQHGNIWPTALPLFALQI